MYHLSGKSRGNHGFGVFRLQESISDHSSQVPVCYLHVFINPSCSWLMCMPPQNEARKTATGDFSTTSTSANITIHYFRVPQRTNNSRYDRENVFSFHEIPKDKKLLGKSIVCICRGFGPNFKVKQIYSTVPSRMLIVFENMFTSGTCSWGI